MLSTGRGFLDGPWNPRPQTFTKHTGSGDSSERAGLTLTLAWTGAGGWPR